MASATILDWTDTLVHLQLAECRAVSYRVYRDGETGFLEMRNSEGEHIHTLELPDGMRLAKSSYEVLLRYVLLDIVAA